MSQAKVITMAVAGILLASFAPLFFLPNPHTPTDEEEPELTFSGYAPTALVTLTEDALIVYTGASGHTGSIVVEDGEGNSTQVWPPTIVTVEKGPEPHADIVVTIPDWASMSDGTVNAGDFEAPLEALDCGPKGKLIYSYHEGYTCSSVPDGVYCPFCGWKALPTITIYQPIPYRTTSDISSKDRYHFVYRCPRGHLFTEADK